MNPLNLMQHFDVNTLPAALQRGLAMLRDPKQTWPLVRADNAAWPALLMGYALWWVLWAVLGALVVHAMTPVWLLAPLMVVPALGGWVLWAGAGWGLYCAWLGLGEITDLPPEEHASAMVVLAISALLAAALFSALGWLTLVSGVIALFVMGQAKWGVEGDSSDADAARATTPEAAADTNAPASPDYEFKLAPATTTTTAASTAANAKKIADLDKKIAKATDQGDMALVSRLMGERSVLQQTNNPDF